MHWNMYVCLRCGYGQYHPINYCPKCPGQLHRRKVEHPDDYENYEQLRDHLAGRGINIVVPSVGA